MQIEWGSIIELIAYIFGGAASLIVAMAWIILNGYKSRFLAVEDKMSNAVSKKEVEIIVGIVQDRFREEHQGLFDKIETVHEEVRLGRQETREDIRDLREALTTKYIGADRRRT